MATATASSYSVLTLGEAAEAAAERGFGLGGPPNPDDGRRGRVYIRRDLDINSFGVNAFYQAQSGAFVIGEHEEVGPGASGHEELYVVVEGAATFTVDGEDTEAPRGTAIFVRPGTKRSARATEDGTIVLVVGGKPGEAWSMSPGESMGGFFGQLPRQGLRGCARHSPQRPRGPSRERAHPLQHRVHGGVPRPRRSRAGAAGRIGRRLAEVQAAGRRGRGLRPAARRPALPGARRRGGVSIRR